MSSDCIKPLLKTWPKELRAAISEAWSDLTVVQQSELLEILQTKSPRKLVELFEQYNQESQRLAEKQTVLSEKFYLNIDIDS